MLQELATDRLQSLQQQLQSRAQQTALLQSVMCTISNVMPATSAQRGRWAEEEEGDVPPVPPQEVLEQVQGYIQQVQAQHDR